MRESGLEKYICRDAAQKEPQYHLIGIKDGEIIDYDGPHSSPEGVVKALKIKNSLKPLFMRTGSWREVDFYKMVTVEDLPDLEVKINREASDILNRAAEDLYKLQY